MQIETKRLVIRDIKTNDAVPFAIMTTGGTLNDGAEVVGSVGCSYYEDLRETRLPILSVCSIETMDMLLKWLRHTQNIS